MNKPNALIELKAELSNKLNELNNSGLHVNNKVIKAIKNAINIKKIMLSEDEFFNLVWIQINGVRILSEKNKPRTLKDIVNKMNKNNYDFQFLASNQIFDQINHDLSWFEKCNNIYANFNFNKFKYLFLYSLNENERSSSPNGSYYLFDGNHKSLVYAKKIIDGDLKYKEIKAYMIEPRYIIKNKFIKRIGDLVEEYCKKVGFLK